MASSNNRQKVEIYPLNGSYIASIDYKPLNKTKSRAKIETVIILDRSGSMGCFVAQIVNEILPQFFKNLNYNENDKIHLITFDSVMEYFHPKISELPWKNIKCRGCTTMHPGIIKLKELIESFDSNSSVRLLTISDGGISDQQHAKKAAEEVTAIAKMRGILINSQAIRWLNSSADTTALCCLLQLNNVQPSKLLDIPRDIITEGVNTISSLWSELFIDDGLMDCATMYVDDVDYWDVDENDKPFLIPGGNTLCKNAEIFMKFPWDLTANDKFILVPGENVFWLKDLPHNLTIDGVFLDVDVAEYLSYDELQNLLKTKFDHIVDHVKILKIVESNEAHKTIQRILEYFRAVEAEVPQPDLKMPSNIQVLKNRIDLIKFKTFSRTFTDTLAQIANDNMVHQLNAEQKANYLRQTEVTKNSKSLARRSAKATNNASFDEIARREAIELAKHYAEIQHIDDSSHEISFYSQATTLEGIRMVIEFTKDKAFESCDAFDILQLLNIVGIACSGPIGDYPDASTWQIHKIYPSCAVSYADIICVMSQCSDNKLMVPAIDEEITNVIPVFDDPLIGKFLKRYAPSLLDITFSIGMRKMIAEVPKTIDYTMIAGVRTMINLLNENKSEKNLEIYRNMVMTLENFAGKFPAEEFLTLQDCGLKGYFLDNSGVADMIVPLIRIIRSQTSEILEQLPAILRSIFNYEVWLIIRRKYRGTDQERICMDMLIKLLGVDYKKHAANVDDEIVVFYDKLNIDYEYIKELIVNLDHLYLIALIPKYLHAAIHGPLKDIYDISQLNSIALLKEFNIDFKFKEFLFANIYQALRYTTKKDRCDTVNKCMLITDTKNTTEIKTEARSFVKKLMHERYEFEIERKIRMIVRSGMEEKSKYYNDNYADELYKGRVMGTIAAMKILNAKTYDEMVNAWRDGYTYNNCTVKLSTAGCPGFRLLIYALRAMCVKIPLRSEIIKVLFLGGETYGKPVWNHGNPFKIKKKNRQTYENAFLYESPFPEWEKLVESHDYYIKYRKRWNMNEM